MVFFLIVKVILSFVLGCYFIRVMNNREYEDDDDEKNAKEGKEDRGRKRLNTTQISWKNENTKKFVHRLVEFEKYKQLKIEMKFDDSYVLPKMSQVHLPEDTDSSYMVDSKLFERFCYQLFFHPTYEKLSGVIRFNERCCGPSKINDQLEENCVNGGATLSFGIEMIQYFIKVVEDGNSFTNDKEIELKLDEHKLDKKLKDVEIEYIRPIPLHKDYRFECVQDKTEGSKYEVQIIGLGSLREEYAIIRGTFKEDEEDEMYNLQGDEKNASIDTLSFSYLQKDEYPPNFEKIMSDMNSESESGLKPVNLKLYKSRDPKTFRIGSLGDKYVVPQYYLIGEEQEGLNGEKELLRFGYVMVRAFHHNKKQETTLVMFFGKDTADPMNQNKVHLGAISTTLDNYAALHVNMCLYPMMICTSFTKVLRLEFNQDHVEGIRRYEFVKLVFGYEKEREVKMPSGDGSTRKAVYGTVVGELRSLDDKKMYAKFEALFTSLEQNRESLICNE